MYEAEKANARDVNCEVQTVPPLSRGATIKLADPKFGLSKKGKEKKKTTPSALT